MLVRHHPKSLSCDRSYILINRQHELLCRFSLTVSHDRFGVFEGILSDHLLHLPCIPPHKQLVGKQWSRDQQWFVIGELATQTVGLEARLTSLTSLHAVWRIGRFVEDILLPHAKLAIYLYMSAAATASMYLFFVNLVHQIRSNFMQVSIRSEATLFNFTT